MKTHYDIIIPVAKKDISFIPVTIEFVMKNLSTDSYIYIITSERNFKYLKNKLPNSCVLLDENALINILTFSKVKEYILEVSKNSVSRTGWYFQQFLKYAFALSDYCKSEYYLSWDADTLPLRKIDFLNDGHPLFTIKNEYNKPYFNTMSRLLGLNKVVDYSFIAEHMLFKKDIVEKLIEEISHSKVEGENWIQKIINSCDFVNDKYNLFSEFETYGTFCTVNYPDLYIPRQLNTFRGVGLIRGRHINSFIIDKLSMDLDIASFEESHAMFPWNLQYLLRKYFKKLLFAKKH